MLTTIFLVILGSLIVGAGGAFLVIWLFNRKGVTQTFVSSIAERIRAVGKLTGLEVMSKEIVTQTKGLKWLPPLIFSQARLAMIFHFEKQYFIDLSRISTNDIRRTGPTGFEITLPAIEGHLTLLDVIPYDIQSGKLLGLFDVFRMDAEMQKEMMKQAQAEAARLYEENALRYEQEARGAIARQIHGLLELFDVDVQVRFTETEQAILPGSAVEMPAPAAAPVLTSDDEDRGNGMTESTAPPRPAAPSAVPPLRSGEASQQAVFGGAETTPALMDQSAAATPTTGEGKRSLKARAMGWTKVFAAQP